MRKHLLFTIVSFSALTLIIAGVFFFSQEPKVFAQTPPIQQINYSESFETDWGGWVADHYLHCEHQDPPCPLQPWAITRDTNVAYDGSYSLKSYLDAGPYDDGTIWVERLFEAPANSNVEVKVSFYLWSTTYSDVNQWPVVAYAGLNNPEKEKDFQRIGRTNDVAGWKQYVYQTTLRTDSTGNLWVAFGFGATWEVARTYYLDLVNVTIQDISHLQYVGYWDSLLRADDENFLQATRSHSNVLFLNAHPRWADFEEYQNSSAFNDLGRQLIIFSSLRSVHLKPCDGRTNCGQAYADSIFLRIEQFLAGDFTAGQSMRERVTAIILLDEPTSTTADATIENLVQDAKQRFGTIPLVINYVFSGSSDWSSYVPQSLDWVGVDPYIRPGPNDDESQARQKFDNIVPTRVNNAKSSGKPVILVAQSYYSEVYDSYEQDVGCKGSFYLQDRLLTATEENWYYDYAKNESQIIGFLWWTYTDSWNVRESEGLCYKFYGAAQHDPAIASLHEQIAGEIIPDFQLMTLKQVDKTTAYSGQTLTYTIIYTVGNQTVNNAKIEDPIPTGTTYVPGSATSGGTFDGTKVIWNLGNLSSNAGGSVSFQVSVD